MNEYNILEVFNMVIDLALSGGGIKGIAHIGVLKQIEERKIDIHSISGCSSGSIIATLFACGYTADEIFFWVKKYLAQIKGNPIKINIFSVRKNMLGLNNGNIIEQIINNLCMNRGVKDIRDIKIPIFIPTVDIITGKLIYFTNTKQRINLQKYDNEVEYICGGDIGSIVRASCSFPGIFSPKEYKNYLLIDGGVRDCIAVEPLKQYMNKCLAVSFNNSSNKYIKSIIDVIIQSFDIMSHDLKYESIKQADYNLEINLLDVKLLDYKKIDYVYNQGYEQAGIYLKNI